ncbi:MAG: 2-dehydro-3-deoxygalactonokinase [Pseudomonadota bacterium]|nr:2-dehydro-3-deoxygalactonokinase [Pseudomonadota bacterium]
MSGSSDIIDCILVDWGTSTLRVWGLDRTGEVVARRSSSDGMGTLAPGRFEATLLALAGDMLGEAGPTQVVVCGMAGARGGWQEAVYREVPCAPVAPGGVTRVETVDPRIAVAIVPGLCQASPADVMRGEETQLAGLLSVRDSGDAVACMPGTHSKWVQLAEGRIVSFATYMTGEVFAVMATHSILRSSLASDGHDEEAFLAAVAQMLENPRELTGAMFSIRSASMLDGLGPQAARARLSGLLIGAELAAKRDLWEGRTVDLVGAEPLCERYAAALNHAGATVRRHDAEALTLAGLRRTRELMREETI